MNVDIVTAGGRPVLQLESDDGAVLRQLHLTDIQLRAAQAVAARDLRTPPDPFSILFKKHFVLKKTSRIRGADVFFRLRQEGLTPGDVPRFQEWLRAKGGVTITRTHGARFYQGMRLK